jgi:hypothetical protein
MRFFRLKLGRLKFPGAIHVWLRCCFWVKLKCSEGLSENRKQPKHVAVKVWRAPGLTTGSTRFLREKWREYESESDISPVNCLPSVGLSLGVSHRRWPRPAKKTDLSQGILCWSLYHQSCVHPLSPCSPSAGVPTDIPQQMCQVRSKVQQSWEKAKTKKRM